MDNENKYRVTIRDISNLAKMVGKLELIEKVADIALEDYKTDPRYLEDFSISIRDLRKLATGEKL